MDAQTIVIGAVVLLVVYYLWIVIKSTRKAMREEEVKETPGTDKVKRDIGDIEMNPENKREGTPILDKVIEIVIIVALVALFASCSSSCSGPRRNSSNVDYSERAQELGTSTKEYADAYNYWKYGNP